ncbi:MAG: hypothetical protein J7647_02190 [Cyanobacteria bacterium SBLK]|nr:hypothetical protein [Cyanobacteria bacterium SBLK]
MKETIVDNLHQEFNEILKHLDSSEISLRATAEDTFRKSLLLAAASYFETQVTQILTDLVRTWGNNNVLLNEFVRNKAIAREYHKLFKWDGKNANSFFALFGKEFKSHMEKLVKNDPELEKSIKAFLEVGNERNRLVHKNYGNYNLEKTSEEIYQLYQKAQFFVENLHSYLANFENYLE